MIYKVESLSLLGQYIPRVYVQNVVLDKGTAAETLKDFGTEGRQTPERFDNDTKCELVISIKDVGARWSNSPRKYQDLKIKIVRSTSAGVTEEFSSYPQPRAAQILQRSQNLTSVKVDSISLGGMSRQEIQNRTTPADYTTRNNVGDVVFEYTDFGLPSRLDHLTYFIFVHSRALEEEQDLGPTAEDLVGMCCIQTVIQGGSVPRFSSIYTLRDAGAVWAGPVHRMRDGAYHTGATHSQDAQALDKNVVSNTKIKDLRAARELQKTSLGVPVDQPRILSVVGEPSSSERYFPVAEKNAVFTDLFSSVGLDDNVALLFGVNVRSLAIRHSKFGSAIVNLSLGNRPTTVGYEDFIAIRGMKIKRRRAKPELEFNSVFSRINGSQKFDKGEVEDVIYSSHLNSEDFTQTTLQVENGSSVRFYTGVDRSLQGINYGKYQYIVELEVADTTDVAISGMVKELQFARSNLLRGQGPSVAIRAYSKIAYTSFLLFGSKDVATPESIYDSLAPLANRRDHTSLVRLFDSLIQNLRNLISMDSNTGVKRSSLLELRENIGAPDRTSKAEAPTSNIVKIEHVFQNEYDPSVRSGTGYDYLNIPENQATQAGLAIIAKEQFLQRVETETAKFFTSMNPNIDLVVNAKNFTNGDSLQKTDVQFFTPAKAKVFNSSYKLFDPPTAQNQKYKQFEKDAFFYNANVRLMNSQPEAFSKKDCSESEQRAINQIYSIFDLDGPTREAQTSFFTPDSCLSQRDLTLAPSIDESSKDTDGSPKNVRPPISSHLSGFLRSRMLLPTPSDDCKPAHCAPVIGLFSVRGECNDTILDQEASEREEALKGLPNQIKSMLLGSVDAEISSLSWMFDMEDPLDDDVVGPTFRINFYGLHKVEAMVGFEVSAEGTVLSRMPRFVPLTRAILESIPEDSSLLCRLVTYKNKDFSLTGLPNNVKLPIYNKHFLIRGGASQTVQAPALQATTQTVMNSTRRDNNNSRIENSSELEQYSYTNEPLTEPSTMSTTRERAATTTLNNMAVIRTIYGGS